MKFSPAVVAYVIDPLERAARTFVQQFTGALALTGSVSVLLHQPWTLAASSAGLAALVSLATSVLTFKVPRLPVAFDITLRTAKTFLQSFVGTITAAHWLNLGQVNWRGSLALAVPVAVSALVTSLAAAGISSTRAASLIPVTIVKRQAGHHTSGYLQTLTAALASNLGIHTTIITGGTSAAPVSVPPGGAVIITGPPGASVGGGGGAADVSGPQGGSGGAGQQISPEPPPAPAPTT